MATIIAGRFQTSDDAARAADAIAASVARDRISIFYVNPPGQHDATPVGGDEQKSPGLERAQGGAGTGAAVGAGVGIAGALIGATAGLAAPMVAIAGLGAAAAGAYGGALAGAMASSMDPGQQQIRHAGMLVAVDAGDAGDAVIDALRAAGAIDIETSEGQWADGTWADFDATQPPRLVDAPAAA